jgi:phenylacetate-CoA ligase
VEGRRAHREERLTPTQKLLHVRERALLHVPVVSMHSVVARTYAGLYEHVVWPSWDHVVRRGATAQRLAFVERMQWRSQEEIARCQIDALRALLAHAGARVPYYRDMFHALRFDPRDVRCRADLAALPVLTREIVRERYRDLVDPALAPTNLKKGTSGSTGAPLKFEYSRESEHWRQAIRMRGYRWAGYRPGLPVLFYWAMVSSPQRGWRGAKIRLDRALRRETFVDSMKQDDRSRVRALDLLRRMRPSLVVCYTQSCAQLARWILDRGLRDWDDVPVLCGAEAVLAGDRAVLSRAFGPVFETYGSRETMLIAAECEMHAGMHLQEENLLVEITRGGAPAAAGEPGDVLVTDLHDYGMPFIRYRNDDVAVMSSEGACGCGRGLRKLERVDGRRADALFDREGRAIPGIVFHVLFSDARREVVRQFQAVQRASGEVVLRVVRGPDWSDAGFDAVARRFSHYLGGQPFSVQLCESIAPAASGKMKTIVVERAAAE